MSFSVRISLTAAAIVGLALAAAPAAGQVKVAGEHIPIELDTPQDYQGPAGDEPEVRWSHVLHDPNATYIALHFRDFHLAPGDYLIVSDDYGDQSYTLEGRGKMNAGTFWARHVKGNTVVLTLVVTNPEGGEGFIIDEYVAGFMDMGAPPHLRAICGTDDKENAKCYETSHPAEYDRGRAVCRLLSNGSGFCTGWLASGDNHVITNEHCVSSASSALNTDFDFMAEAPTCGSVNCPDCYPGTIYSGGIFIQDSYNLDYCLMKINVQVGEPDPAATFGYLELDNRVAVVGEEIYIIGHPDARAKEFSIYSTHPSDTGGIARVYSITRPACQGSGYNDVGYYADTEGGSSGSPVLARSSHKVIALHHCANCPNRGVPIHLVYAEVEQYLTPGPAGTIDLDKGHYGCADVLAAELRDGDLLGDGSHDVTVTTSGGDSETVTLAETGPSTGIFTGSIATAAGTVVTEDGMLQVVDGETITITYIDADDGQGGSNVVVTDAADVDCQPPSIFSVQVTTLEPRRAVITIDADEPVVGTVHYGTSCVALTETASGSSLADPATVELTDLQDGTAYYFEVEAEDEAANVAHDNNGGLCYSFTTPDIPDFFTELFDASDNDLDNITLEFTPNGSVDFYAACAEPISELPTDPNGGTPLTLSDQSYQIVNLGDGKTVSLYGTSYTRVYVGSNGYITFTAGDTDSTESLTDHFDTPRVSALFDDLDPGVGGSVSWQQLDDRLVVTYLEVPERSTPGDVNTFQIELYFDGRITISYLQVLADDGLAGLSEGNGQHPEFSETDLTGLGECGPKPPEANDVNVATAIRTPVTITLDGEDDGLPDPPAALTCIVTSLPAHGDLYDPGAGQITSVPYTLVNGGSVLDFDPDVWYAGTDSFLYKVNDGGTPPEGGDSPAAQVSIVIGGSHPVYVFTLDEDPLWSAEGDWAYGVPTGQGGDQGYPDPTSGHTDDHVLGYNLDGDYGPWMSPQHLTSTAIDCSDMTQVSLRFWRWLGVEMPPYDHACVYVSNNGTDWLEVWRNTEEISDDQWNQQQLDISTYADNQPTVYVRWTMGATDGSWFFCGWNLDDIALWGIVPPPEKGDMDCDGVTDYGDINPFVLALVDPALYWVQYPDCDIMNGDINGDRSMDFGDINAFVDLLVK